MENTENVINVFSELEEYCSRECYKGWDPYDGLNSKVFQSIRPIHSRWLRLIWIQFFKLSPFNFRMLFNVPKGWNSKGLALFLRGYCNMFKWQKRQYGDSHDSCKHTMSKISFLAIKLIEIRNRTYNNSCWGYNFDWQNRVFFQPNNTPTVVATSFVADALFEAYEVTSEELFLRHALSACEFVINDLNRYESPSELIFSYSPLDNSKVYNASLLGARLLSRGYTYTKNNHFRLLAEKAVSTVVSRQGKDGSWIYGEAYVQGWRDSFHTGFNLECIYEIGNYLETDKYLKSFEDGFTYYKNNFFSASGIPKYYHNETYPVDIHSPAQFIATLVRTKLLEENRMLASKTLNWTIRNMYSRKGFFYYQKRRYFTSKISYIRWSQAWMFYALSEYLHENLD